MPYKSEAQRKYFNSPAGKAKIGSEEVEHWNEVSKGLKLPNKLEDAISACDKEITQQLSFLPSNEQLEPSKKQLKEYTVKYNTRESHYPYIMVVKAYSEKQAIAYATQLLHKQGVHKPLNMRIE